MRAFLWEFFLFGLKQARACIFAACSIKYSGGCRSSGRAMTSLRVGATHLRKRVSPVAPRS